MQYEGGKSHFQTWFMRTFRHDKAHPGTKVRVAWPSRKKGRVSFLQTKKTAGQPRSSHDKPVEHFSPRLSGTERKTPPFLEGKKGVFTKPAGDLGQCQGQNMPLKGRIFLKENGFWIPSLGGFPLEEGLKLHLPSFLEKMTWIIAPSRRRRLNLPFGKIFSNLSRGRDQKIPLPQKKRKNAQPHQALPHPIAATYSLVRVIPCTFPRNEPTSILNISEKGGGRK